MTAAAAAAVPPIGKSLRNAGLAMLSSDSLPSGKRGPPPNISIGVEEIVSTSAGSPVSPPRPDSRGGRGARGTPASSGGTTGSPMDAAAAVLCARVVAASPGSSASTASASTASTSAMPTGGSEQPSPSPQPSISEEPAGRSQDRVRTESAPATRHRGSDPGGGRESLVMTTFKSEGSVSSPMGAMVSRRGSSYGKTKSLTIDTKINCMLGSAEADPDGLHERKHPAEDLFTPGVVASVWGTNSQSDLFQPYFSGKAMNFDNCSSFGKLPHSIGVHCQRGHKPNSPNQDTFFVLERREWLCFGVMDGHGDHGHLVSQFVQEHLPKDIMNEFKVCRDWETAAKAAFDKVAQGLKTHLAAESSASGTTASLALITREPGGGRSVLRCAFVGDSSIVYAHKAAGSTQWKVRQLGENHKPDREDELKRIESMGGTVLLAGPNQRVSRLLVRSGGLAMSRSLGDFDGSEVGLSAEPECPEEVTFEAGDDCMILICSDGIWDVLEPNAAVQLVSRFPPENTQGAAEKLASKAQNRWQQEDAFADAIDDITVCMVRPTSHWRTPVSSPKGEAAAW